MPMISETKNLFNTCGERRKVATAQAKNEYVNVES
jgi:hypothetical protein